MIQTPDIQVMKLLLPWWCYPSVSLVTHLSSSNHSRPFPTVSCLGEAERIDAVTDTARGPESLEWHHLSHAPWSGGDTTLIQALLLTNVLQGRLSSHLLPCNSTDCQNKLSEWGLTKITIYQTSWYHFCHEFSVTVLDSSTWYFEVKKTIFSPILKRLVLPGTSADIYTCCLLIAPE